MFGKITKRGRPPEDRLRRQREIFRAVAPLIEARGARRLTMREAGQVAHLSLGGLYHYFPTKEDLVLHAIRHEPMERICRDFVQDHASIAKSNPEHYLELFVSFLAAEASSSGPRCGLRWSWESR